MKKLINSTETLLAESLDGFAAAHADIVALAPERRFLRRRALTPGKVAFVSGGGSGRQPLHSGFVGYGMRNAACPAAAFTAATPAPTVQAARAWTNDAALSA